VPAAFDIAAVLNGPLERWQPTKSFRDLFMNWIQLQGHSVNVRGLSAVNTNDDTNTEGQLGQLADFSQLHPCHETSVPPHRCQADSHETFRFVLSVSNLGPSTPRPLTATSPSQSMEEDQVGVAQLQRPVCLIRLINGSVPVRG
jgi:hypothetical protein